MSRVDEAKRIERELSEIGMNIPELIAATGGLNTKLLKLNDDHTRALKDLYQKLIAGDLTRKEKGYALESLMYILFHEGYSPLFECKKNRRTSTNEIDILLCWTQNARVDHFVEIFPFLGERFLCECKNYVSKVDVTYVGKFYSLLKVSNAQTGIMIAWEGVTGRGKWDAAAGLIKKIALKDDIYIIVLDKHDLAKIAKDECNIFKLIEDKYNALAMDIDYERFIEHHENESEFSKSDVECG